MSIAFVGDWLPLQAVDAQAVTGCECVVGNLECVVSDEARRSEKAHNVVLPSSTYELIEQSGFTALSLANNHVNDAGPEAFAKMLDRLDVISSIQFYGTVQKPFAALEHRGQRIAVIGCLEKCRARGSNLFREEQVESLIRELRNEFDRVIVTPHWAKESEFALQPSPRQTRLAARWMAVGCDGIVGHHPHVIHGSERIGGRPVYYSVGNFEFLHLSNSPYPAASYGMAIKWDLTANSWTETFLGTQHGKVEALDEREGVLAEAYFNHLSEKFSNSSPGLKWFRWARRVGGTYIPKSMASWKLRLRRNLVGSLPRFGAWCLLPMTWLLALGNWFPDSNYLRACQQAFDKLRENLPNAAPPMEN